MMNKFLLINGLIRGFPYLKMLFHFGQSHFLIGCTKMQFERISSFNHGLKILRWKPSKEIRAIQVAGLIRLYQFFSQFSSF